MSKTFFAPLGDGGVGDGGVGVGGVGGGGDGESPHQIGVRDLNLVARSYFIPGGASQRGGGQAPMFQCRTLLDTVRGQGLMG